MLSLNWFRNCNPFTLNTAKQELEQELIKQFENVGPVLGTYKVEYNLYYKNPSSDGSNIIALVEKSFLDGAQKAGLLKEDNVKHHKGSSWSVIAQDKDNPRCEISIKEFNATN